ncbi:hypothetical protein QNH47_16025 [Virgibacillus halodenitrificans]|uniref:hypothetical protein n=1 Tax=Virgibacillus halodenitrificans TaxID=1482 RepID=UPI0024BF475B|nr:hypothetical protein [Virgibacillus halodenitrificans]WHX25622.1 hypothetical protein QNH47_16025 [Virgibacillus halodenitrificans]
MKKLILLAGLLFIITALAACGDNEQSTDTADNEGNESTTTEDENQNSDTEKPEDKEVTNGNTENNEEAADIDLTKLPEYSPIKNHIDLDAHHPVVVEDNEGKRIILFRNEKNQEKYKSIFIKEEERVKIIDLDKGEIFNGLLK